MLNLDEVTDKLASVLDDPEALKEFVEETFPDLFNELSELRTKIGMLEMVVPEEES